MIDRHLPGFAPGFIRLELEHIPAEGWQVEVTQCDSRTYVTKSDRTFYEPMSWDEAVQLIADHVDAIDPRGHQQEPF